MGEGKLNVEILTAAGPLVIPVSRLDRFKAEGATNLDGSEIETPQEKAAKEAAAEAKKAKKKKKPKE